MKLDFDHHKQSYFSFTELRQFALNTFSANEHLMDKTGNW
jgi:hypothetical protein